MNDSTKQSPKTLSEKEVHAMPALVVESHGSYENRQYDLYTLRDSRVLLKYTEHWYEEGGLLYASKEHFKIHKKFWPSSEPESGVETTIKIIVFVLFLIVAILFILMSGGSGSSWHSHRWGRRW